MKKSIAWKNTYTEPLLSKVLVLIKTVRLSRKVKHHKVMMVIAWWWYDRGAINNVLLQKKEVLRVFLISNPKFYELTNRKWCDVVKIMKCDSCCTSWGFFKRFLGLITERMLFILAFFREYSFSCFLFLWSSALWFVIYKNYVSFCFKSSKNISIWT